jgi:DNA replication protein DnaC
MTAPTANRTYQQLRSHLAYLKLDAAAEALAPVLDEGKDASQVEVLERLLGLEVAATATRRRESRRRLAGLPADWRLADFDTDAQPSVTPELLRDLAELRFIDTGGNVLFIGPPGVGTKTVLAIGLGHAAIDAGHRAYYTTAADLVARCHKAAIEGRWANTMRFFAPPPAAHHRRARLPATHRRGRLVTVPGDQPPLRRHRRLGRAHHQPRHQSVGRDL